MDLQLIFIVVAVVPAVFCAGLVVWGYFEDEQRVVTERIRGLRSKNVELISDFGIAPPRKRRWAAFWERNIPAREHARTEFQLRLFRAGFYRASGMSWFFAARATCLTIPVVLAAIAIQRDWIPLRSGAVLGASLGVCGSLAPSFLLDRLIQRRLLKLRQALPDFLDLMIICLESGLGLQSSLLRVSEEIRIAHPLLANELMIVIRDMELGSNVDVALNRCAERTGFLEMRGLGSIVREAQRFGSELSSAFDVQADTLRFDREQAAEETAQKASVKLLVPMLLLILPGIFIVLAGPAVIRIQEAFSK